MVEGLSIMSTMVLLTPSLAQGGELDLEEVEAGFIPPPGWNTPPPVPVPGNPDTPWKPVPGTKNRPVKWVPEKPVKGNPRGSQPSSSYDKVHDHWDVDDDRGNRDRFDRNGRRLPPHEAHRPGRKPPPVAPWWKRAIGALGRVPYIFSLPPSHIEIQMGVDLDGDGYIGSPDFPAPVLPVEPKPGG